ncbi:MAG: 16S rRNA (cytidine(1402)-2'-O)-methyltransferase [Pseudomonadota bacterium]
MATPIGNLGDLSPRASETLAKASIIACEDTRVTGKLLRHIGASTPLTRFDGYAKEHQAQPLAERALVEAVALTSDAGTPLISDPGYILVRLAQDLGVSIYSIAGPSALAAALSISGLPTESVCFLGFPPAKSKARLSWMKAQAHTPATLVFFEAPHRIVASLSDMASVFGGREATVARELTKKFETSRRGPIEVLAEEYAGCPTIKGEFVIMIAPPAVDTGTIADDRELATALADAREALTDREAVHAVAYALKLPRKRVYQAMLAQKATEDPS